MILPHHSACEACLDVAHDVMQALWPDLDDGSHLDMATAARANLDHPCTDHA